MYQKLKKTISGLLIVLLIFSLASPNFSILPAKAAVTATDLFISEYIEGSSYNKAIEIFNGTGKDVDLKNYKVELYSNGSATASNTLDLSSLTGEQQTLKNGATFIIAYSSAAQEILDKANITHTVTNFNGDDAFVLKHGDTVIDSIGEVGKDPGSMWGAADTVSTVDQTLVRKSNITEGDKVVGDSFDPTVQWENKGKDHFDNLGTHTMDDYQQPTPVQVAVVTASIPSSTVDEGTKVELQTATAGAKIYYTTDGSTPTIDSAEYTVPITIDKETTIKAMAVASGLTNSEIKTFTYKLLTVKTIAEVRATAPGENVKTKGMVTAVFGKTIYFQDETAGLVLYSDAPVKKGDTISVKGILKDYSSLLEIETDPSNVTIISENGPLPSPEVLTVSQMDESKEGKLITVNKIKINAFSSGNYKATDADGKSLDLRPVDPTLLEVGKTYDKITGVLGSYSNTYQLIPRDAADVIENSTKVSAVKATPAPGMIKKGESVTLSTGTAGATIYYTTDGSEPTVSSDKYTAPIVVDKDMTIQAIAVKEGLATSDISELAYTIYEGAIRIHTIQGEGHTSPFAGGSVVDVEGIVTFVDGSSVYLQDQKPDNNIATSEGIIVYKSNHGLAVGDIVKVSGGVTEYTSNAGTDLTLTEINATKIEKLSSGNELPAPIKLGVDRVAPTKVIDNDKMTSFDPEEDGIDFYESMEAMYIQVDDAKVTAPQYNGEVHVVPGVVATNTEAGGLRISADDYNPEKIALYFNNKNFIAKTGDYFEGAIKGVIGYGSSIFRLITKEATLPKLMGTDKVNREVTKITPAEDKLTIASYNVENFSTKTSDEKVTKIAKAIITNMKSPDIIGLVEIQDNDGETDSGTVDASESAKKLINKIKQLGGPDYLYTDVAPVNKEDGGAPGGNIRVAFIYNKDRVSLTEGAPKGTATQAVGFENGKLTLNPGRIAPTNEAFDDSRKPLAAQFNFKGQNVIVVANHFNSKGGDQPLFGKNQPPVLSSEAQRLKIASVVNGFVEEVKKKDQNANIVLLGDFNDFEFTKTLEIVKGDELTNMIDLVPEKQRYTYSYSGNSQVLDHILVSNNLVKDTIVEPLHINSSFMEAHGRASDHDPVIIQTELKPVKVYNLVKFKTKTLVVDSEKAEITIDADSVISESMIIKGQSIKLKGEGLKNTKVIINPTKPGTIIDFSGAEVKEVQILNKANIKEIRGKENVKKWDEGSGLLSQS